MIKKTLKKTNTYLKDPELGKALLYQSVSSSTAGVYNLAIKEI